MIISARLLASKAPSVGPRGGAGVMTARAGRKGEARLTGSRSAQLGDALDAREDARRGSVGIDWPGSTWRWITPGAPLPDTNPELLFRAARSGEGVCATLARTLGGDSAVIGVAALANDCG